MKRSSQTAFRYSECEQANQWRVSESSGTARLERSQAVFLFRVLALTRVLDTAVSVVALDALAGLVCDCVFLALRLFCRASIILTTGAVVEWTGLISIVSPAIFF